MFRIYLRSSRTIQLLRSPVILQRSRLQRIHCSSSCNLPRTAKSSDLSKINDDDDDDEPPVKRTRRKSVGSKAVEGPDGLPVKVKKSRSKKSVTSEDVEEEDGVVVEPVKVRKPRSKKSVTPEDVEEEDGVVVEPVKVRKPRSKKSVTPEDVEEEDGVVVEPVKVRKPRSKKSVTPEDVEEEDGVVVEPVKVRKPRRKKSVTPEDVEEEDGVVVEPVKVRKPRSKKSVTLEGVEEKDGLVVEPVKRRRRKSASVESVVDNQDESVIQAQTSSNTSQSLPPPVEPVMPKKGRPFKYSLDNGDLEGKSVEPGESKESNAELEEVVPEINENDFIKIPPSLKKHFAEAYKGGATMGDRTRINIVNEALCDDIMDRLKPSLSKHMGCDIIDINPGVGIWSSKIHDFLKPRSHLLMEPDVKKYLPYLQPLLDARDSTYRHIPKSGTVWEHLGNVTTPEFLPHQVKLSPDDPKINEPNDTLLVIANLGHFPRKRYRGFESISQLVIYQLLSAARSHALFHQYGLIRMLIWLPDEEKAAWLVRNIAQMRKNAMEAQITTKYIREIASSTRDNHRFVRDSEAALQNSIKVVTAMNKMGITTPKHRHGEMEIEARKSLAAGGHEVKIDDFDRFKRGWLTEWQDLTRQLREGTLNRYSDEGGNGKKTYSEEYRRLVFMNAKIKALNGQGKLASDLIKYYNEINEFQAELKKANPDSVDLQASRDRLKEMIAEYDRRFEKLPIAAQSLYIIRLDAARITTEFEKREVEPLKLYANEFIPSSEMCLLDFQPQALWPILRENYPENFDVFEYILSTMYASPISTVYEALEGLWPGAMEYIVDGCPSLTDPSVGGGFDLKHMTVRSLTPDMLKEILEAWMKWPFRPTRYELMYRSGSSVYDPDRVEDEGHDGPHFLFDNPKPYLLND
ncbi:hypothetical protein DSL72_000743 [Monilinia vaccinii-corymbosi]|uniref:Mitochondrial transcription factor 1 n=1 Tax=Monilinia vaccinii-corymbosi TaxID=61207 RepID=A0A8A3P3J8_9HELO|nr:hypothetical protein DSL72_000743 [Monilinia vaccinii-corymbosi]